MLVLVLALAACNDRVVRFCDESAPASAPNSCPVAGAGGGGGGGAGGTGGIGGTSGAAGIGGTAGVGGVGGSAGTAGAPPTGGTGGGPEVVDASAPLPDSGADAGDAAAP